MSDATERVDSNRQAVGLSSRITPWISCHAGKCLAAPQREPDCCDDIVSAAAGLVCTQDDRGNAGDARSCDCHDASAQDGEPLLNLCRCAYSRLNTSLRHSGASSRGSISVMGQAMQSESGSSCKALSCQRSCSSALRCCTLQEGLSESKPRA